MTIKVSKTKANFWLLTIYFAFLLITGILLSWTTATSKGDQPSQMMGGTMGNMMKHKAPKSLNELFKVEEFVKSDMSSHHGGESLMSKIHFVTTVTIVTLLPFIFGGVVFLIFQWL